MQLKPWHRLDLRLAKNYATLLICRIIFQGNDEDGIFQDIFKLLHFDFFTLNNASLSPEAISDPSNLIVNKRLLGSGACESPPTGLTVANTIWVSSVSSLSIMISGDLSFQTENNFTSAGS